MLYINLWKWGKKKRKKSHSHLCEFCVSHFREYDWTFALRLTYMAKKRQSKSTFSPWKADGSLIIFFYSFLPPSHQSSWIITSKTRELAVLWRTYRKHHHSSLRNILIEYLPWARHLSRYRRQTHGGIRE